MQTLTLGKTGLTVSEICLGTMTWGTQNTEADGHAQADMALDHGVTFWDTAEMYPVNPVRAETAGRTEEIIGTWLAARKGRDRLVIATKISGRSLILRPGQPITGATLREALEALDKDMDFLLSGDVFTRPMLEGYMALKWEEVYAYEHTPHPVEYQMYYSC